MNTRSDLGIFRRCGQKKCLEVPPRDTNPRNSCRHHGHPPATLGADPRRPTSSVRRVRFGWDGRSPGRRERARLLGAVGIGFLVPHFYSARFLCGPHEK